MPEPPRDASGEPPAYPITQTELESYRQLETVCRRYGSDLSRQRASIMGRMGGPDRVEPGPLRITAVYRETGLHTIDEHGERHPVSTRHLVVYEIDSGKDEGERLKDEKNSDSSFYSLHHFGPPSPLKPDPAA